MKIYASTPKNAKNRYFHVTESNNLDSIYENGLLPQMGARSSEFGESMPCICLFSTFANLEDAVYNWLGDAFDEDAELVVLQIDLPNDFPLDSVVGWETISYIPIPPEYITAVYADIV